MEREVNSEASQDRLERHRLARALIHHVPYRFGSCVFRLLLGNALSHKVFRSQLNVLTHVKAELGLAAVTPAEITRSLMVNYTLYWRLHALMRADQDMFDRFVVFEGEQYLKEHYGKRGIVLCNSHYGAGKLVPILFARRGYDLSSVDRVDVFSPLEKPPGCGTIESIELGKKGNSFLLKHTFQMKKALQKKSLMHVAADGYRGASGAEYMFLGKKRPLRQSFADLAVATDSVVLPVFSRLLEDGRIKVTMHEPFDPAAMEGDKKQKVNVICEKYLALLEQQWKEGLEYVFKNDIRIFHKLGSQPSAVTVQSSVA